MEILVAPISGSLFPAQVCSLIVLCENGYKPEICFAGSGGSVTSYIGNAAYWNPAKIRCVASSLNTKIFISEWTSSIINVFPKSLLALVNGSFYKTTSEATKLLSNYMSPKTIQDVEIWVAAVNSRSGRVLLSCNKSQENSIITGQHLNVQIHDYEKLHYLNGNVEAIATSILASSCIPMLISPVVINKETYVDCGLEYGSSFTPMYLEVLNIAKEKGVHIIYLTGCDLSRPINMCDDPKFFDNVEIFTSHATRSFVRQDRNTAYLVVANSCGGEEPWYKEFSGKHIPEILACRKKAKCSLVEIYPSREVQMDLQNFCGQDVIKCIDEYKHLLKVRVWWSGSENVF